MDRLAHLLSLRLERSEPPPPRPPGAQPKCLYVLLELFRRVLSVCLLVCVLNPGGRGYKAKLPTRYKDADVRIFHPLYLPLLCALAALFCVILPQSPQFPHL